jgi:hypothetical protein
VPAPLLGAWFLASFVLGVICLLLFWVKDYAAGAWYRIYRDYFEMERQGQIIERHFQRLMETWDQAS